MTQSDQHKDYLKNFPTLDSIVDSIKRIHPNLWKLVLTKHIEPPANYYSLKLPAVTMASALITATVESRTPRASVIAALNIASAAAICQRYNYPAYYVSKNILAALSQTEPPEGLTWGDLKFPFDGLLFMLPKGIIIDTATKEEISFLGIAKLPGNETIRFPYKDVPAARGEEDKITIFWSLGHGLVMQDITFSATQALKPSLDFFKYANERYRTETILDDPYPMDPPSEEQGVWIAALIANCILLLQAEPELIEYGGSNGKRLKKSGMMCYKPTFLGFRYTPMTKHRGNKTAAAQIQQEIIDGKRRMFWAKGHWQTIRYGEQRVHSKRMWIQPYRFSRLINAPENEND